MNYKKLGEEASFFKILLRDSIDRLPLPPAFAKKHLETSNTKKLKVVLKLKSGAKWSVKCSKIKDKYYFMDGWLKFMQDNGLRMGVFLVFWSLPSRSSTKVFRVFVYGPNGCLMEPTTSNAGASNQKRKMTKVVSKSYYAQMPMNNSFLKATGISSYRNVQLRNDVGTKWDVKLITYKYARQKITRLSSGWGAFRKDNKIEVGNICEFYHVKSNLLRVRVFCAEEGNMKCS